MWISDGLENEAIGRACLVLLFLFHICRVNPHLFVILFERCKILTSLREFALLHSLADIPVHEGALGVKKVKFAIQPGPCIRDGGRVREHANASDDAGEITIWDVCWWFVGDTNLEARWTPVNEPDGTPGLQLGDSGGDVS